MHIDHFLKDVDQWQSHNPVWCLFSLLLLITQPLPRDGGMAEYRKVPEAGQHPRAWTRGRRETESRQRVSGAKSS